MKIPVIALFCRASFLVCSLTPVLACVAHADTVASFTHAGLKVTLDRPAPGSVLYSLEITSDASTSAGMRFEAFTLPDPPRLVVDILEHPCPRSRRESFDDPAFEAIRFGGQASSTRVVIDARHEGALHLGRIVSRGGGVVVRFALGTIRATPSAQVPLKGEGERELAAETRKSDRKAQPPAEKPGVESKGTPADVTSATEKAREQAPEPASGQMHERTPSTGPEATGPSSPASIPGPQVPEPSQLTSTADPQARDLSQPASTPTPQAEVTGISFEWLDDHATPALAIAVNGLGRYSFGERHSRSYVVIIENARVSGSDVVDTRLAPEGFRGVRAVSARREAEDVVVKIYVERGTKLTPSRAPGKLWVKVSGGATGTIEHPDTTPMPEE